jgi:carbon storage regulator CsrA
LLVLTHRLGEQIVIDGRIIVTVVAIEKSGKVRIGITAPRTVQVDRKEIHERRADWRKDPEQAPEQADADEMGVGRW